MTKAEKVDELMRAISHFVWVAVGHHTEYGGYFEEDIDDEAYDKAEERLKKQLAESID